MTLEDYVSIYNDMLNQAIYFEKIGNKLNNKILIENSNQVKELYKDAIQSTNIDDAETYYNEIRAELFECEELLEDIDYEEDES